MGDSETTRSSFGKWLRQKRRALDLTQEAFADQVGCARITLRRIESDALKPSKELALLLLEKVGIPQHEREAWLPFARGLADLPFKQTISFPAPIRNNLPACLTTFIGREKEQADVLQIINKHRLVTLTGSGGVGKTRLSIQTATDLLTEFPIGVWLVELAPLTDPALVPQSVCAVMGVKPDGDSSALEALTNYLRNKKLLLILDNCEHLIDACAQLCNSLLRSCPELRILASSREDLGIDGEHTYKVPSLSLPNSKSILNIIQESEAVKLFVERATFVQPEFALTESNAPFIAQICQRLDGIALAIELAASRVKMFKVEQIAARLDDAFGLLTSGNRTALPRQQTLRALIDWSYNLLSEEEKIFLRKLSVFMGGWTLEAAEAVCENKDAVELLTHLVDKSLVSVDHEHGDEARYYLLETVRQYANEILTDSGQLSHLRDLHLDYFLKTAERIAPELTTRKMPFWLDYLEVEYPNLQAALEWGQVQDIEAGLRLSNALYEFWFIRGEYRKEGIEWFEKFLNVGIAKRNTTRAWALFYHYNMSRGRYNRNSDLTVNKYLEESLLLARELEDHACVSIALEIYAAEEMLVGNLSAANEYLKQSLVEARLSGNQRLVGRALYRLGELARTQLDWEESTILIKESVDIFCNIGNITRWALSLNYLGITNKEHGDWKSAQAYFEEALVLAEEARDRCHASMYLGNLGGLALGVGDLDRAFLLLSHAHKLIRNTPDDDILHGILRDLGEVARFQGNFDQSVSYYRESLALPQVEFWQIFTYCGLADVERLQGQVAEAGQHLLNALNLLSNESDRNLFTDSVIPSVAYLAVDQQNYFQAISLFGWVDGWNRRNRIIQQPIYQEEFDRYLLQARKGFSDSEFNAAWAEGQSMSQEQVLALAMGVLQ